MKCRICNNELHNTIYTVREMMLGTREKFEYFQCDNCKCLQIHDMPHNMSKYYPENYCDHIKKNDMVRDIISSIKDKYIINHNNKLSQFLRANIPCRYEWLPHTINNSNINHDSWILDIGCGSGVLLEYLHCLGFEHLIGVDPFVEKSSKNDIVIYNQFLEDFTNETTLKFDLIILNHSFEHMPNPGDVLACINRLLLPGGICIIRIPTITSQAWQIYKENWVQLDAPRHLFLHSIKSMEILCQDADLKIIDSYYDSTSFQFIGSEQYLKDIPLYNEYSHYVNLSKSKFTKLDIKSFRTKAKEYNANRCGDQIVLTISR